MNLSNNEYKNTKQNIKTKTVKGGYQKMNTEIKKHTLGGVSILEIENKMKDILDKYLFTIKKFKNNKVNIIFLCI